MAPSASTFADLLPREYGWVLIVAASHIIIGIWLGGLVMGHRKYFASSEFKAAAKDLLEEHKKTFPKAPFTKGYPDMGNGRYSDKLTYEQWFKFNNAQRAHHNFLESVWGAFGLTLVGGLFHPVPFAGLGAAYVVGRILYGLGYNSSAGPKGRELGAILGLFAQLGMVGMAIYTGVQLIKRQ